MYLISFQYNCWLNVLLGALNLRIALQQQPSVSQPFFLPSSLLRRQSPPPLFIQPAANTRPVASLPPGFAWVSRRKLRRELAGKSKLLALAKSENSKLLSSALQPQPLPTAQPRNVAGDSRRIDLKELDHRSKQKVFLRRLIDPESDPRFLQTRAPVQQPFRPPIDQNRRQAPPAAPVPGRARSQPTTTVLTAKQSGQVEQPPQKVNPAPLARPTPAPQRAPSPASNSAAQINQRPVQVSPARQPVTRAPTPPSKAPPAPTRAPPPVPSRQPELALLQFPPARSSPSRSQQAPVQVPPSNRPVAPQQPAENRPPAPPPSQQQVPTGRGKARPAAPPLEQISQNVVVQKEAPKPEAAVNNGASRRGPPGFTPPSNSVVEELNNSDNFMAVAERLQLRTLVGRRKLLAGRAKRHSDFVLKRQALDPSMITAERHSNSESIASVPETTIHKTVNMSVPINVPARFRRNSELDVKTESKKLPLPLTSIRHANSENLGGIPLKNITKTVWKMPLTMTVQQKLRIVPKEN